MLVGTTGGRYLRTEVLGQGSTATVYCAHDQLLDRKVALKEIHLANGQSVTLAEARAAAGISHQNVVTIHDVIEDGGSSFIAMELLDGPTLGRLLQSGRLAPEHALRVACDVAAALEAAHRRGVTHCDIKPDNIFVTAAGRTVVTDFGLAAPELGGGTPGYMSPEQYGDRNPAPTMDVFAWACLVAELLAGEPPFGMDPDTAPHRTAFEEPIVDHAALADLGIADLVCRCLSRDPRGRPQDGSELLRELQAIVAMRPPTTVPTTRRDESLAPGRDWARSAPVPQSGIHGGVRLIVYPPGEPPWHHELGPGESVEVGREAALPVPDPLVSRRHAAIWFDGTHLHLADLGSMNGTMCNGSPVDQCLVVPGDVISIGSTTIAIQVR